MFPFRKKTAAIDRMASAPTITEDLISRVEIAKKFGVSEHTLRKWELSGQGPPTIRVGRRIFYRAQAIRQWLLEREAKGDHLM